ncbi:MAG: hypothetical protein LBV54_04095 [Puniceicoccales bacterium]|jgi:hypothetical protein|nr:hypothetical protein [Puniceicoccales bacterium]
MSQFTSYEEYERSLIEKALDQARKEAPDKWKVIERQQKLATAHLDYGFPTKSEFIRALQGVRGVRIKGKGKRVRLTPEIVAKVKDLKAQGKGTTEISRALGISAPSVYKITKA